MMAASAGASRRWSLRPIPLALGVLFFIGLYFSPVADQTARSIASVQSNGASQRDLFYEGVNWMGAPSAYAMATAGQPANRHNLVVMGSSELESVVPQNPRVFLPAKVSDFDLFLSGRGHTQSLYHAIELAAMAGNLREKKVALIISPQWFDPGGVDPQAFRAFFSDTEWQGMLDNPQLAPHTKAALIDRVASLMNGVPGFDNPNGHGIVDDAAHIFLTPYEQLVRRGHTLMLESESSQWSLPYRVAGGSVPIDKVDWAGEQLEAQAEGASLVHNQFGVADPYFATYIQAGLAKLKGSMAGIDYAAPSAEYGDLELFLDVAKDLGVRVLLVSVPMNGKWYDYAGYGATRRADYYSKIRDIPDRHGVQLADFSQNEYQPYFMYDVMHLGWIGWLDVIQACVDFQRS
jgi:D-alanine transfer protein